MPEMSDQYEGNGDKDILSQDMPFEFAPAGQPFGPTHSDGSTASYYELPPDAPKELQDLISYRNMNGQMAEIFRACYRYGQVAHSPRMRDIKKIIFYAQAELARLEKYGE